MTAVVLVARIILAALFTVAGLAKLRGMSEWQRTLLLVGVPPRRVFPLALMVPLAELTIALALTLNATARWGAVAAVVILCAFSTAVSVAVLRRRTPDCNCFGSIGSQPLGWRTVGRNVLFAALAGLIVWSPGFGLPTTAVVGLTAAVVLVIQAWFGFRLLQQNGRLLARVDALEAGGTAPPGLAFETPAPSFFLEGMSGGVVSSGDIWPGASSVLLTFVDPDCAACDDLAPDLVRWIRERVNLDVAVITAGDPEVNRRKLAVHGLERVGIQRSREVADAYRVPGTPAAVLVDSEGKIASETALGADAIRALANGPSTAPPLRNQEEEAEGRRLTSRTAGLVATGTAVGVALAGTSLAEARADDAGIVAIKAKLDAAKPTLVADVEALQKGIGRLFGSKKRLRTGAARAALSRQREDSLALQADLAALVVESAQAQAARDAAIASLEFQVQAFDEFDRLLGLRAKKARKRANKKIYELLQQARAAGYYLNVGLGCTGKDC